MTPEQTTKIRELNDQLRRTHISGGRVVVTRAVHNEGPLFVLLAAKTVTDFSAFTPANDPHQEHDMGFFECQGNQLFWKIDTFSDGECMYGSEEPWNPDLSYRILTIGFASDY